MRRTRRKVGVGLGTAVVALAFGAAAAALCFWEEGQGRVMPGEVRAVVANLQTLPGSRQVALTFDDGPDPRYTPEILRILDEAAVRATFFVVGKSVEKNPMLVVDAFLAGHELANHTWSHHVLTDLSWSKTVRELSRTQDLILTLTGHRTRYFRPPKGKYDADDIRAARAMGYRIVMWTVCLENKGADSPREMVDRVLSQATGELVVLLHDGLMDRAKTVAALPMLIDGLKKRGYAFVTVSELLAANSSAELRD